MIHDATINSLGEGPLWHPTRKQFFWFDIMKGALRTQIDGKTHSTTFSGHTYASAAGWIDHDTLMVATNKSLLKVDIDSGDFTEICALEADNPITRSNDGRADPQGGFWIGTMGINAEDGAGAIYRYYRGELRKIIAPVKISNAICFAPDGRTAYYADTPTQQIMATQLDADGWPTDDARVHIDLTQTGFFPDGAVVDAAGNLWNAQWGASRVACYDPQGRFTQAVSFPALQTSCPAFGGPDLKTLYCTSAAIGLETSGTDDGKIFATPVDATGQAEHQVIL